MLDFLECILFVVQPSIWIDTAVSFVCDDETIDGEINPGIVDRRAKPESSSGTNLYTDFIVLLPFLSGFFASMHNSRT